MERTKTLSGRGRLANLPFGLKLIIILGFGVLMYVILFIFNISGELLLQHGYQAFSWELIILIFQKSLIWGSVIGSVVMFLTILPGLIVPKISIREDSVVRRVWLSRHKWYFSGLRFYDFALSAEEVDGRYLRFLLLADAEEDKLTSFEIPISIDESQLVDVFIDRLPSANEYFENQENKPY